MLYKCPYCHSVGKTKKEVHDHILNYHQDELPEKEKDTNLFLAGLELETVAMSAMPDEDENPTAFVPGGGDSGGGGATGSFENEGE